MDTRRALDLGVLVALVAGIAALVLTDHVLLALPVIGAAVWWAVLMSRRRQRQ